LYRSSLNRMKYVVGSWKI